MESLFNGEDQQPIESTIISNHCAVTGSGQYAGKAPNDNDNDCILVLRIFDLIN